MKYLPSILRFLLPLRFSDVVVVVAAAATDIFVVLYLFF